MTGPPARKGAFLPERVFSVGRTSGPHFPARLVKEPASQAERWRKQADLLDLSTKARLRLEWLIFWEATGRQGSKTAAYFGISRETLYRWIRRFAKGSVAALEDGSHVARKKRTWQPDPEVLERMLALRRRYPCWGKETLAAVYESWYGERVSPWQFQRMVERFRMQRPKRRPPRSRRRGPARCRVSYKIRKHASLLWQLDTIHLGAYRYVVTAVEHATKLGYAHAYPRATSGASRDFLRRLSHVFGTERRIKLVLTDNGSEFEGSFAKALEDAAIARYYSRPRRPTDNPEAERFNQTLQDEWYEGNGTRDLDHLNRTLAEWLAVYNWVRPHHALGLRTPAVAAEQSGVLSRRGSSCADIQIKRQLPSKVRSCRPFAERRVAAAKLAPPILPISR
ncbi:MAG: integrase core domain-containing protein [Solirubrobacterales bacterium]